MPYTLRLLTLDQLGRAAGLICALELERQKDPAKRGSWPFEIALWVGRAATPNRMGRKGDNDERTARVKTLRFQQNSKNDPPLPLEQCPWCGTKFQASSFQLCPNADEPTDLWIRCVNRDCDFTRDRYLPIVAVDADLRAPSGLHDRVISFAPPPSTRAISDSRRISAREATRQSPAAGRPESPAPAERNWAADRLPIGDGSPASASPPGARPWLLLDRLVTKMLTPCLAEGSGILLVLEEEPAQRPPAVLADMLVAPAVHGVERAAPAAFARRQADVVRERAGKLQPQVPLVRHAAEPTSVKWRRSRPSQKPEGPAHYPRREAGFSAT
jgi:hypothetical protein